MSERYGSDGSLDAGHRPSAGRVKPRVVYLLLSSASLAGVWVSHWGDSVPVRLVWWGVVVTGGALAGGLYWRLALFDASAFDDAESLLAVRRRWRRIETTAVWLFAACGLVGFGLDQWAFAPGSGGLVFLGGSLLGLPVWLGIGSERRRGSRHRVRALRIGLLSLSLVALVGFARLETGSGPVPWLGRLGHVGAFSLWLGGATWHNFVVLPTTRTRPSAADALKQQARRFRHHLPVAVAILFLTGIYQATRLFGPSLEALLGTAIGLVVVGKGLVLATLTGFVIVGLLRGPG